MLSRWPKVSFPRIIHRFTNLPLLDYTITVNVDPLSVRKEITREEKAHDRLADDYASEKKLSLVTTMEKKQRKIAASMQGHTLPFNVHFVVRAWDRTKDGLAAKLGAIKNAIHGMNGAQYFECTLPTTSKNVFIQTWPGCGSSARSSKPGCASWATPLREANTFQNNEVPLRGSVGRRRDARALLVAFTPARGVLRRASPLRPLPMPARIKKQGTPPARSPEPGEDFRSRLIDRFVAMRNSQVYGLASPRKLSILSKPRVNVSWARSRASS